jgi:hypothetical protein
MTRATIGYVVCLLVLVLAVPASAQTSAGGSVRGTIRDEQGGVLPGVTVTAQSATAPKPVVAVSDAEGVYRLVDLDPGTYTITAELEGFAKVERPGVGVHAALNIEIDVAMKVGSLSETVQVKAETPMLEVQRPVQAVNITGDMQRALPLTAKRDWYNFLEVTPSVTNRSVDQSGGQVYMLRGSEIEGHVFQLDGADVGSFRQSRADYIQLSTDAIQDVQVKTGAVDASAPIGVGVVVSVATQSGTNQIKGAGGVIFTPKAWNGNNADAGGSTATNEVVQPDVSLGGPIMRDKAFFFGAYRYSRQTLGISRDATQVGYLKALVPSWKAFDNENRFHYSYAKVTLPFSTNQNFVAFFQNDMSPQDANYYYNGSRFERTSYGGKAFGARLSSVWGTRLTTKLAVSYNDKSLNRDKSVFDGFMNDGPSVQVFSATATSSGHLSGAGLVAALNNVISWTMSPTSKYTIQGDATYYRSGWLGSHEFQTGFFLQPNLRNRNEVQYANGGANLEEAVLRSSASPDLGYVVFHKRLMGVESTTSSSVKAQDYAIYAQDTWKPTSRLSITAGVRADYVTTKDVIFSKMIEQAWNIGPRVGATYMVTKDGHNVLRGSWSIVHDMPQSIYIQTIGSTTVAQTDYYDNNLDGTFEMAIVTPPSTALNQNRQIDSDYHQPFIKEGVIGFAHQFPGQLSVDVTVMRRNYMDRPALIDVNGIYDGVVFKGYKNEALNDIDLITNNTYNWFVYSGFEMSVSKRAKDFQLIGGYTRGWQHMGGTWQPNDPASFIQPDTFANDRGLGTWRGNNTNSLSGTADIRSPSWQKHVFRIGGSYNFPWSVTLASSFTVLSGPFSGPIVTKVSAVDPQFGPSTITLSNGRTVTNPLATTIRFAYSNRGEGQLKTPNLVTWNMKLQKDVRFGERKLQLSFDVFNVLNGDSDQQFKDGGNQTYSANYAMKDGVWQGTNRQAPRIGQVSARFQF